MDIEALKGLVIAGDLMTRDPFTLFAHDNLETAFDSFGPHRVSLLPVTPSYNPKQVVGILKKDDLLPAYRERVLKDRHLSLVFKGKREV